MLVVCAIRETKKVYYSRGSTLRHSQEHFLLICIHPDKSKKVEIIRRTQNYSSKSLRFWKSKILFFAWKFYHSSIFDNNYGLKVKLVISIIKLLGAG